MFEVPTTYQIIALMVDAIKCLLVAVCGVILCRIIRLLKKIESKM